MSEAAKCCSPVEYDASPVSTAPARWRGLNAISDATVELAREMEKSMGRNKVCEELGISRATLWRRLGPSKRSEDKQ
jgi:transcriptional regulator of acetoin/glycerol metabolism